MAEGDQIAPRKRWRGRLLRFLLWCAAMAILCAALAGAGGYMIYQRRVKVVNYVLKESVAPSLVEIGEIEFPKQGLARIAGVVIRAEPGARPLLEIPILEVTYSWRQLREAWEAGELRLHSVVAVDPVLKLDEAFLESVVSPRDAAESRSGKKGMSLRLEILSIQGGRVEVDAAALPMLSFGLALEARDLTTGGAGEPGSEPLRVSLSEIRFQSPDKAGASGAPNANWVSLPSLDLELRPRDGFRSGTVEPVRVSGLAVNVTPGLLDSMDAIQEWLEKKRGAREEPSSRTAREENPAGAGWTVKGVALEGGRFALSGFDSAARRKVLPDVLLRFEGDLSALAIGGGGLTSEEIQRVRLFDVEARGGAGENGGDGKAAARIEEVEVEFVPGALMRDRLLEKVRVEAPSFEITGQTVARFLAGRDAEPDGGIDPVAAPEDEAAMRKAFVIRDLEVRDGLIALEPRGLGEALPKISANFEIATGETDADLRDASYRAMIRNIDLRNADYLGEELAQVESIEIAFTALGVQRETSLDRVDIAGFHMAVAEPLQDLIAAGGGEPGAAKGKETGTAGESIWKGWRIGELNLKESTVSVAEILPDFPMINFGIQTMAGLEDLTVGGGEGKAGTMAQRVELVNLELRSPLNPSVTVAELRTIFVEFTLRGLLNRVIDGVEIVSPDLYVGEHLFWFVDYQRKRKEAEKEAAEAGGDAVPVAATGNAAGAAQPGWSIKKIDAYNGRLIFAPKGYAVGFNPFPFAASTNLESGEIELDLEVPKGTYSFADLELEFEDLEGSAQFNVPIRQEDNNLVETFAMKKLRYKKYEAENVWLTVTYNEKGIYPRFGGDAYGGYVNGLANIYVGEKYGWDASVSGTDIDLEPLTRVAAPENFLMIGKITGVLVGGGVEKGLGLADGSLEILTPGRLEITKLDELLEKLPSEWSGLKETLARVGIERLRDFDFTAGNGTLGFVDPAIEVVSLKEFKISGFESEEDLPESEGKGILKLGLEGPEGKRAIEINYHKRDRPPEDGSNSRLTNASKR